MWSYNSSDLLPDGLISAVLCVCDFELHTRSDFVCEFEYSLDASKLEGLYFFFISAERVHALQPYKAVDMTMARSYQSQFCPDRNGFIVEKMLQLSQR